MVASSRSRLCRTPMANHQRHLAHLAPRRLPRLQYLHLQSRRKRRQCLPHLSRTRCRNRRTPRTHRMENQRRYHRTQSSRLSFLPHRTQGEGLFLSLLRKTAEAPVMKRKRSANAVPSPAPLSRTPPQPPDGYSPPSSLNCCP